MPISASYHADIGVYPISGIPDIGQTPISVYADRVSLKSAPISVSILRLVSEYTDIGAYTPISAFGKNPDDVRPGTGIAMMMHENQPSA